MRDPITHLHFAAELLHDIAPEIKDPSERRRAATTLASIARALIRYRTPTHAPTPTADSSPAPSLPPIHTAPLVPPPSGGPPCEPLPPPPRSAGTSSPSSSPAGWPVLSYPGFLHTAPPAPDPLTQLLYPTPLRLMLETAQRRPPPDPNAPLNLPPTLKARKPNSFHRPMHTPASPPRSTTRTS